MLNALRQALTDKSARAGLLTSAGVAAARASTLVATLVVAALLLPAQFAQMSYVISTGALVGTLGGLGLSRGVARLLATQDAEDPRWAYRVWHGSVLATASATGLILLASVLALGWAWSPLQGLSAAAMGGVALTALGWVSSQLGISRLVVEDRFARVTVLTIVRALAMSGAMVATAFLTTDGGTVALATGVADLATGMLMLGRPWPKPAGAEPTVSTPVGREMLLNGAPAWIGEICATGYTWFGLWLLLEPMDSPELAAAFSIGQRLYFAVLLISNQLVTTSVPELTRRVSSGQLDDARRTVRSLSLVSGLACGLPCLILVIALSLGLDRVFPAAGGAVWLVQVMVIAALLSAVGNIHGVVLQAGRRLWSWMGADLALAVLFVLLALTALWWGATMIAVAFVVGHAARNAIVLAMSRRVLGHV